MKKSFLLVFLRLLPQFLGSPVQGPAVESECVDVPPPTTVTTILGFIAGSGAAEQVKPADSLACRWASSRSSPLEQVEVVPVWRTLE